MALYSRRYLAEITFGLSLLILATMEQAAADSDGFFTRLQSLCGQAFAGTVVSTDSADAAFNNQSLIAHVRDCRPDQIRIPFHVGTDRSRTWVITRTPSGLRLKHDHRHADGQPDVRTDYGGDSHPPGQAGRQEFPADAASKAMFMQQNLPAAVENVWALEINPGRTLVYELQRPGRHFRVQFDLTRPIAPPPPPWGASP